MMQRSPVGQPQTEQSPGWHRLSEPQVSLKLQSRSDEHRPTGLHEGSVHVGSGGIPSPSYIGQPAKMVKIPTNPTRESRFIRVSQQAFDHALEQRKRPSETSESTFRLGVEGSKPRALDKASREVLGRGVAQDRWNAESTDSQ